MGLEAALWRSVAVYRWAALAYAAALIAKNFGRYEHPLGGWAVLGVMTAWTAYATFAFADPRRRGRPLLAADMAVTVGCLLATVWVESAANLSGGSPTLPVSWVAAAILSWAVSGGKRAGLSAAAILTLANFLVHVLARTNRLTPSTVNGIVLLFLAGLVVGHVVKLALDAEARLARAVELESATRERERLARRIHDSVLQVLAMVQRRGGELGGEAAELGRLAGEQEAALRALIGSGPVVTAVPPAGAEGTRAGAARAGRRGAGGNGAGGSGRGGSGRGGGADLRPLLTRHASTSVTVSTPATPVLLPEEAAREVEAAVAAALDNVRRHGGGARAWVLLEDGPVGGGPGGGPGAGTGEGATGAEVTVSVRDDGPGMPPGRLEAAAADGRLGVAQSILGRIRDLGGTVSIVSAPGEGTEIEMTVPVGCAA